MVVEFKEITDIAAQLESIVEQVPLQITRLEKEIKLCDMETSDLLHLIELASFNASEGYKYARDLQITRQQRRKFKDELESLNMFQEKMTKNRSIQEQARILSKLTCNRNNHLLDRNYHIRVREDLRGKFSECKRKKLAKGE